MPCLYVYYMNTKNKVITFCSIAVYRHASLVILKLQLLQGAAILDGGYCIIN